MSNENNQGGNGKVKVQDSPQVLTKNVNTIKTTPKPKQKN